MLGLVPSCARAVPYCVHVVQSCVGSVPSCVRLVPFCFRVVPSCNKDVLIYARTVAYQLMQGLYNLSALGLCRLMLVAHFMLVAVFYLFLTKGCL